MSHEGAPNSGDTSKFQAVIPLAIRQVLGIADEDKVLCEIGDDEYIYEKPFDPNWNPPESVAEFWAEWASEIDEEAYGDL